MSVREFPDIYRSLLLDTINHGVIERNKRTGTYIKVHHGGCSFRLDLGSGMLPIMGYRKTHLRTVAAEVAWFLMGTKDPAFICKYSPIWDKFIETDAIGDKRIARAYGYRWRKHFGFDQLSAAVCLLYDDPTNRRIWISAWDPFMDWSTEAKNVPCPVGFTLSIIDGRLHSSYMLRSSDLFIGLPYDVMAHTILMDAIATELGVGLGTLHVTMAHPHIYQAHWEMVEQTLREPLVDTRVELPRWTINQITGRPEEFVQLMDNLGQSVRWPSYNPRPEIIA